MALYKVSKTIFEEWIASAVNFQTTTKLFRYKIDRKNKNSWFKYPKIQTLVDNTKSISISTDFYIFQMTPEERAQTVIPMFISIVSQLLHTRLDFIFKVSEDSFETIRAVIADSNHTFSFFSANQIKVIYKILPIFIKLAANGGEDEDLQDYLQTCFNNLKNVGAHHIE